MDRHTPSPEYSGSLTPQLEGSGHSLPHGGRDKPLQPTPETDKGRVKHE